MNQPRSLYLLLLILASMKLYAFDISDFGFSPRPDVLLKAIKKAENKHPTFTYESPVFNFADKIQCLYVNHLLHKGERRKSNHAFKWTIDVPKNEKTSKGMREGVAELDALVEAGLLSKISQFSERGSIVTKFDRYRLTMDGWANSKSRGKKRACFALGRARHIAVKEIKEIKIAYGSDKGKNIYEVQVLAGFPYEHKFPFWANHPAVRKAYPLIDKFETGFARKVLMEKRDGEWKEYQSPSNRQRMSKSSTSRLSIYYSPSEPVVSKEFVIKMLMNPLYQKKRQSIGSHCVPLPGLSSGLKVDRNLGSYRDNIYKVAIFDNKERTKWDEQISKTLPYLNRLVSAGLLTSTFQANIAEDNRQKADKGKFFSGSVFELSPDYSHIISKEHHCIYLGESKITVVDVKTFSNTDRDSSHGYNIEYKFLMSYPNPPEWAKDQVLQAWWSDLKGALNNGKVCKGNYEYDRDSEFGMGAGVGSCWWAFDSAAE